MPRIGLLSDSHGRAHTTQQAVDALVAEDVSLLLHLGDIGTLEVLDALLTSAPGQTTPIPARIVFGNTDWDLDALARYAQSLGIQVDHPLGRVDLGDGSVLAFTHGHEEPLMAEALSEGVRYLCHGHTHRTLDHTKGNTRIINPGALFRASQYTAAVLDTQTDDLKFLTIDE